MHLPMQQWIRVNGSTLRATVLLYIGRTLRERLKKFVWFTFYSIDDWTNVEFVQSWKWWWIETFTTFSNTLSIKQVDRLTINEHVKGMTVNHSIEDLEQEFESARGRKDEHDDDELSFNNNDDYYSS